MKKKICILDYGSGNVASVYNMINFLGFECKITNENYNGTGNDNDKRQRTMRRTMTMPMTKTAKKIPNNPYGIFTKIM